MSKSMNLLALAVGLAVAGTLANAPPVSSKEFTYDDKVNKEMAKKLNIPIFFAVPASARLPLPKTIETTDRLIDFKHPDGKSAQGDVGLRLLVAKRAGFAQRMGKSGLIQTGDILLSFRSEWGGTGAYPNVQMGISHTGLAFVKDGVAHNIDNPLEEEYLGPGNRGELNGKHYRELQFIHVIRPRNLSDAERANIVAWATRLTTSAKRVYPAELEFNKDYNAPKYHAGKPVEFVKQLGQIALGQNPPGKIGMYCSEFVWSLLALRNCDPAKSGDAFSKSGVPSCVKPVMEPMKATGDYISRRGRSSYVGLAEGPLLVVDSLKLPDVERDKLLHTVFVENKAGMAKMSVGHREVAEKYQADFAKLEKYYLGVNGKWGPSIEARLIGAGFRSGIPQNYSPTSYLLNTLLPANNSYRTMDYVATIVFE